MMSPGGVPGEARVEPPPGCRLIPSRSGVLGLEACESWARDRKIARIAVNVYDDDEALRFYAAIGFETSTRRCGSR